MTIPSPNPFQKPTTPKNGLELLKWLIFEPVVLRRFFDSLSSKQIIIWFLRTYFWIMLGGIILHLVVNPFIPASFLAFIFILVFLGISAVTLIILDLIIEYLNEYLTMGVVDLTIRVAYPDSAWKAILGYAIVIGILGLAAWIFAVWALVSLWEGIHAVILVVVFVVYFRLLEVTH